MESLFHVVGAGSFRFVCKALTEGSVNVGERPLLLYFCLSRLVSHSLLSSGSVGSTIRFLCVFLFAYSVADLYQSGFHPSGLRNLSYYLSVKKLIPQICICVRLQGSSFEV